MSRTAHHFKQRHRKCGLDYWSPRPGTWKVGGHPGRFAKTVTHRLERRWPGKTKDFAAELD